jgi:hypothetical protein
MSLQIRTGGTELAMLPAEKSITGAFAGLQSPSYRKHSVSGLSTTTVLNEQLTIDDETCDTLSLAPSTEEGVIGATITLQTAC